MTSEKTGKANFKEAFFRGLFFLAAGFGVAAVATITVYLLAQGIPAIAEIGFFRFLFGSKWFPSLGKFGILTMIVNSLYVTGFSLAIGFTLGFLTAVFLAKFCPKKLAGVLKQIINLLAGIPSVVYGLFGANVLIPFFASISPTGIGSGLMVSGIVLGIMILPTIASVSLNSLNSLPPAYYEGALALGATKEQAVFRVLVPAAKNGILAAVILGFGRAIGETMAISMVSGNVAQFVTDFFTSMRTLTGNIVFDMSYARGLHYQALIATGAVLFVFILLTTLCFNVLVNRRRKDTRGSRRMKPLEKPRLTFRNRRTAARLAKWGSAAAVALAILTLAGIVVFVLARGIPHLKLDFVFGQYSPFTPKKVTMLPALISTLILVGVTLLMAVPIGVCAAIYLAEYTKKGSRLVKVIRSGIETLAGIPSIVFGLFGMLFFNRLTGGRPSLLSGSLTLLLMILPVLIRSTEEALRDVPDGFREGSLALGAGKLATVFKVVLPSAVSGIVTGIILSVGRIVGESAALIFTAGTAKTMPSGLGSEGCGLAAYLYWLWGEGHYVDEAYAVGVVLLLLIVVLNLLSTLLEKRLKRRVACA